MKFTIVAIVLLGIVTADVSHLSNEYLPPVFDNLIFKQQVSYNEKDDNSIFDDVAAQEEAAQIASGQLVVNKVNLSELLRLDSNDGAGAYVAHQEQTHAQEAVTDAVKAEEYTAPGSDLLHSTFQQALYYAQVSQEQEPEEQQQKVQEPEQYYAGGNVPQQEAKANIDAHNLRQEQQQEYHEDNVAVVQEFSRQQQQTGYYSQQTTLVDSSASAGIDTQYGANGGYIYARKS